MVPIEKIITNFRNMPELMTSTRAPTKKGEPAGSKETYIGKYVRRAMKWCLCEITVLKLEDSRQTVAGYVMTNWQQFEQQPLADGRKRWRLKKSVHDRRV